MTSPRTFAERLHIAVKRKEIALLRNLTQREIGELVATELGRDESYKPPTVQGWLNGAVPERYVIRAIAAVLDCDPVWLETGKEPGKNTKGTDAWLEAERAADARHAKSKKRQA